MLKPDKHDNKDHSKRVIVGPHGAFIAQQTNHSKGCKAVAGIMVNKK